MKVISADAAIDEAIELLEKANADLEPELLSVPGARARLKAYSRAQRLAAFGVATLARRIDDASELARVTGTSVGRAKETVTTGRILGSSDDLSEALRHGDISLDQAAEIAKAEESSPGAATELLTVAREETFNVLKEKARKAKLEAEQHQDLAQRQRAARSARSYSDDLGMININLVLEPHVGTPIVARAETDAARLARVARKNDSPELFERYLADSYAALLRGSGKGPVKRPELVVLVSHEVIRRGWKDVREGELCKIPGVGPVSPQVAKEIARDAFLNGVFYDGVDLRNFVRWSKHIPIEVAIALELGEPPSFDGVACVDCGNRFRNEFDHVEPRAARGPTCNENIDPRCWTCHRAKTARDRKSGKLTPPEP